MKSLSLPILGLALLAATPGAAQIATNSKAPVDITGDSLETGSNDCSWTWRGNVEALQDNARLRAETLTGVQTKGARPGASGCGDLVRLEAHGSVFYVTPQQRVRGDDAVYEAASETMTVTGDVVAVQGQNVLRGERLVINVKTGQGQMETGVKGRNRPGRVRGVFYPNQSNNPQSASASQRR